MINEKLEEKLLEIFEKRYKNYNDKVLEELGNVIKEIGDLIPKDANRLGQQLKYNYSVRLLVKELSKITKMSMNDLYKVLEKVAKENLGFAQTYYEAKELDVPIYKNNKKLQSLIKSIYKITGEQLSNISKSSAIMLLDKNGKKVYLSIDKAYREVIDRSVVAIRQGKDTYYQLMKGTINQLAASGVRSIRYDNVGKKIFGRTVKKAYSQRIDTAIRRNVQDGIRQLSNESQKMFGEEFGADGVEISVHSIPAPDHEKVQGRQFSNKEYYNLQNTGVGIDCNGNKIDIRNKNGSFRPISVYNCYHYVFSIVLGISKPSYTSEELKEIIKEKSKKITFEGKKYNKYEVSQLQRNIETKIREKKDGIIVAKASEDNYLLLKYKNDVKKLTNKYNTITAKSGLENRLRERTYTSKE